MEPKRKISALRISLDAIAAALLIWAVWLWTNGHGGEAAWIAGICGAIWTVAMMFEQQYYRPNINRRLEGWEPTEEKFVDPVTGEPVQVWFNPTTGGRVYRPLP